MRHILNAPQREVLVQLSWSNVLLGFDFDGTLSPIVSDPARAALSSTTRQLLSELARLYPCVVISGRSVSDVRSRLEGIEFRSVIGNHGLEPWRATEDLRALVGRWQKRLAPTLSRLQGVVLEDKTYSLAIHYRLSRAQKEARLSIAAALELLGEMRVIPGKHVVNVLPLGAPHKGVALERERERFGCDTAFFIGDDETDEDVFALDQPGRLLTVRVGAKRFSRASYCLRRQSDVDALLRRLIELRQATAGAARRRAR